MSAELVLRLTSGGGAVHHAAIRRNEGLVADALIAGATIKKSGIYSVRHDGDHAGAHDVTCVAGKPFPLCAECGDKVRFVLVRAATHVGRHEQFRTRIAVG
jgi:hypothetical protein